MDYHIYNLFPNILNAYSDRGNIITLEFFIKEMQVNPIVHNIDDVSQINFDEMDFLMIGGGFEKDVLLVVDLLRPIKDQLKAKIVQGLPVLITTSFYPVIGTSYQTSDNEIVEGLNLVDMVATYQDKAMVSNVLLKSNKFENIIGFTNHKHEVEHNYENLGEVITGYGNTLESKEEGLVYNNMIATFLSGPLLSKNYLVTLFFLEDYAKRNKIDLENINFDVVFEKRTNHEYAKRLKKLKRK